jgi:hypothetical protein
MVQPVDARLQERQQCSAVQRSPELFATMPLYAGEQLPAKIRHVCHPVCVLHSMQRQLLQVKQHILQFMCACRSCTTPGLQAIPKGAWYPAPSCKHARQALAEIAAIVFAVHPGLQTTKRAQQFHHMMELEFSGCLHYASSCACTTHCLPRSPA